MRLRQILKLPSVRMNRAGNEPGLKPVRAQTRTRITTASALDTTLALAHLREISNDLDIRRLLRVNRKARLYSVSPGDSEHLAQAGGLD